MAIVSSIILSSLTNHFCYNFSKCGTIVPTPNKNP